MAIDLDYSLYAFDSTTIDLCLSLFPWAQFRKTKAAIKMHTFIDLRGAIPTFISLTTGKVHDVNVLDILPLEKDAVIAMDRGYVDYSRLYAMHLFPAFFVIRAKSNLRFRRLCSREVDKTLGLRSDQTIVLTGRKSRNAYPEALRRVSYMDLEKNKRYVYLTNIFIGLCGLALVQERLEHRAILFLQLQYLLPRMHRRFLSPREKPSTTRF